MHQKNSAVRKFAIARGGRWDKKDTLFWKAWGRLPIGPDRQSLGRGSNPALDEYRENFVDRYVENYAMLTRVIKVEADVKHSLAKPKTVDDALAEL